MESIIVLIIVLSAGGYLVYRIYRQLAKPEAECMTCRRSREGCSDCPLLKK